MPYKAPTAVPLHERSWLTQSEYGRYVRAHRTVVARWITAGVIPDEAVIKVGKTIRINRALADAALTQHRTNAA